MREFPFQLLIKQSRPQKQAESLTCTALLRAIPGRREVYDALWNGQSVIVKTFSHKISAWRHLRREWRGLSLLQERGLNSPKPLFWGQTQDGKTAMVVEKIANSSTVSDIFHKTEEKAKKFALLALVCKEMAKQHSKGVLQKDLHLGNFLLADARVFTLDCSQMRFSSSEVTRGKGISQLALLARSLPANDTEAATRLCEEYALARGWQLNEADKVLFQKWLIAHRKKGVRNGLKKSLRTGKRYQRMVIGNYLAVLDRNFYQGTEPLDLIKRIDSLMDKGQILKKGNTCYVSRINWNGQDIVVKRYNYKGFVHSLRHTIKKSRAKRCWLNGHLLRMLDVATPKPLAYIEEYRGLLLRKSYLITEYVGGQKLCDFLQSNLPEQKKAEIIERIKQLLDKLWKHHITHGDMKHSNILVTDNRPVLTDLDSLQVHKWYSVYKNNYKKDIARLTLEKKEVVPL